MIKFITEANASPAANSWNAGSGNGGVAGGPYEYSMLAIGFILAAIIMVMDGARITALTPICLIVLGFIMSGLLMLVSFPFFMLYQLVIK